ncbi:MAG: AAA family ATPase [Alphaproteobacteria bacterium]|nr:AAA family ATPase [Alphaproteobacteria bacterium]
MNSCAFDHIFGQEENLSMIKKILENRAEDTRNRCFIFSGPPGTGKTSAAKAIAEYLECHSMDIETVDAGNQLIDRVRERLNTLQGLPWSGSARVLIVDEADKMSLDVETFWKGGIERNPPHGIIIFTTNHPEKISPVILQRGKHFRFEVGTESANAFGHTYWEKIGGAGVTPHFGHLVEKPEISFREIASFLDDQKLSRTVTQVLPMPAYAVRSENTVPEIVKKIRELETRANPFLQDVVSFWEKKGFLSPDQVWFAEKTVEKILRSTPARGKV